MLQNVLKGHTHKDCGIFLFFKSNMNNINTYLNFLQASSSMTWAYRLQGKYKKELIFICTNGQCYISLYFHDVKTD